MLASASARRRRAALAHVCVACHKPWALRVLLGPDGVHTLSCRFCSWQRVPVGLVPAQRSAGQSRPAASSF